MSTEAEHSGEGEGGQDALVAEFVLGLLDAVEHQRVARRIAADHGLRAELRMWRTRFQSFDSEFADEPAPAAVLGKVEARLFGAAAKPPSFWESLAVWRAVAAGALAVAVVAIGVNVMRPAENGAGPATQLVASLKAQDSSGVEFVAFYDSTEGSVKISGLSGDDVPAKDFELWYINEGEAPVSMGVVPVGAKLAITVPPEARTKFTEGTVLAVTLEQDGGSPTGAPQGAVVSAGPAVKV